jgi:hypothetical protein
MAYTTINKSSEHFNTKLYTGNGSSLAVDTGIDLTANGALCIAKNRNASNKDWYWVDTVRGANKTIHSNGTGSEQNYTTGITGFNNNGFQVGSATQTNGSGNLLIGYNWKAGTSVTGSANTDGDITSTITANTISGFSIVKYTGTGSNATVGHGLGAVPKMIMTKNLQQGNEGWQVYHETQGNTKKCALNETGGFATDATAWNSTTPTNNVFYIGTNWGGNGNGHPMIAYCFAEKQGFSKFGSYSGNGNVDGNFIYTGFKPAFFMQKRTDNAGNWAIFDNKRANPFNEITACFEPNTANVEQNNTGYNDVDFLSNGIKIREDNGDLNTNGGSYIYMAFAEAPLVGTNGVTAKAR